MRQLRWDVREHLVSVVNFGGDRSLGRLTDGGACPSRHFSRNATSGKES